MKLGSTSIETWIPAGGFRIAKRKLQTPDHGIIVADCLVPKWDNAQLESVRPCDAEPCLHHIFADCEPDARGFVSLANRYGLLTTSIMRQPSAGEIIPANVLPAEPIDVWCALVRELHTCADLWETIRVGHGSLSVMAAHGARLSAKLGENLARLRFSIGVKYVDNGVGHFQLRYRSSTLAGALWQRMAEEVSGVISCMRCPAPRCGRWFLIDEETRNDKRYCSGACRSRIFRQKLKAEDCPEVSPGLYY
jgi:hypothetical protein